MTLAVVLFLIISSVFAAHIDVDNERFLQPRMKRGASGALQIVTNHAQPIHADVKSETSNDRIEKSFGEQPCPKGGGPAHIEPGVGFKVTPPEHAVATFEQKSLRRFFTPPSTLTLIRSISRVVTLVVLFISAVLEFYPTFQHLITIIFSFINA